MKILDIPLDQLILDEKNARKHPARSLEMLAEGLKQFGQQKPIVIDKKNKIVAGNGTVMAAKMCGWDTIKAAVTELEGVAATAYAIADNQLAGLSEWDLELYGLNIKEIRDSNWLGNWNAIGFEKSEIDLFLEANWSDNNSARNDKKSSDFKEKENIKPVKLTKEQRAIFDQAFEAFKLKEGDDRIMEGRFVELLCADYISSL